MSVYVDDMRAPFGRMIMCHMIADSRKELDAMADQIGVARRWIQKPGTYEEHYDIALSARKKAVAAGAVEVPRRELVLRTWLRSPYAHHRIMAERKLAESAASGALVSPELHASPSGPRPP
jgi:hypothetical protein